MQQTEHHYPFLNNKIGNIAPGMYADMMLLDSWLDVKKVYVGGKEVKL